jgi:hypothetical protein
MDGEFCMTSPNYPAKYDSNQGCKIEIYADGMLTSTNFSTEAFFDILSIGGTVYSGQVGPVDVPVQAGMTLAWKSDKDTEASGWRLCWSGISPPPYTKSLQVLSLARNYIVGKTAYLDQGFSLQTLLISSNYLVCRSAELENATELGQGNFVDPTSRTLHEAGKAVSGEILSNPFKSAPNIILPNTVLAFAGNSEMSREAALLPPTEAGRLLQEDEIEDGRPKLFPGHSDFWQFMCCVLPALVLFYGGAVVLTTGSVNQALGFVCTGLKSTGDDHILARSMNPLVLLLMNGLLCVIINMIWSRSECIDYIIQTTITTVQTESAWQWLWVILNCSASVITTMLLACLQPSGIDSGAECSQSQWLRLVCTSDRASLKQAIVAWRMNMQVLDTQIPCSVTRVLISWFLHLPVLCISMAPSAGYVLAMNVPATSAWYLTIFKNPLVVTTVKLLFSQLVLPPVSLKLARFKYGITGSTVITSYELAVRIHHSQANSFLAFGFVTVLAAPMIAVAMLDESCLRYYLAFADNLRSVMTTWSIGEQGLEAYRYKFCSRTLVTQFTWVWLQLVAIKSFATPALHLLSARPGVKQLKARLAAWASGLFQKVTCKGGSNKLEPDARVEALKEAERRKEANVELYLVLLALVAFGPLCPLLFVMAPMLAVCNLSSVSWVRSQNLDTHVQQLANSVVVQHPTTLFSLFAVSIQWLVATAIFIE